MQILNIFADSGAYCIICVHSSVFGDNAVPARVKTGLSAFVALFMYNIIERPQLSYVSAVGFAVLVVKEGITGLLIGFAANICNSIVILREI